MKKPIVNYAELRDAELLAFGRSIYSAMNGNVNFPNPIPNMPAFLLALDAYDDALTEAKTGSRNAVAVKNAGKLNIVTKLRSQANYVNSVCNGDPVMLASSNFKLAKDREPVYIGQPVIAAVLQGLNAGSMIVKVQTDKGAISYLYQTAPDPINEQTEWITVADTRIKYEFTGLEEGKKYWFRVAAVGSNGQTVYSTEVAQFVMQRSLTKAA